MIQIDSIAMVSSIFVQIYQIFPVNFKDEVAICGTGAVAVPVIPVPKDGGQSPKMGGDDVTLACCSV